MIPDLDEGALGNLTDRGVCAKCCSHPLSDAVRQFGRVVIGQQEAARAKANVLGLAEAGGDEQVGCGMGFFSIAMARMVGDAGRVIATDVQPQMLAVLETEERLQDYYVRTMEALVLALEAKEPESRGHSRAVARIATAIARQMGFTNEELDTIIEYLYEKLEYRNEEYDAIDESFTVEVEAEIDSLFAE